MKKVECGDLVGVIGFEGWYYVPIYAINKKKGVVRVKAYTDMEYKIKNLYPDKRFFGGFFWRNDPERTVREAELKKLRKSKDWEVCDGYSV